MPLVTFLLEAMAISLSGVMAPGPMTAAAVGKGSDSPRAGALLAIGHGIVEFPLMVAILYGFGLWLKRDGVKAGIALVGGIFLLVMAIWMLRGIKNTEVRSATTLRSPVIAGIGLSVGNPYFLIWWATVGATLVTRSIGLGVLGFALFAVLHWACDFVWLQLLSTLSFKGGRFFGRAFQKGVFAVCGVLLLFFAGKFLFDGISGILP
jgi:threonine/homoserine/homoserine lactone efflux protein